MSSSDPLTLTLPRGGPPPTLEARALFRLQIAAVCEPAGLAPENPDIVMRQGADGGMVVYPPSDRLLILAAARLLRAGRRKT
jgi:hypothetical protein